MNRIYPAPGGEVTAAEAVWADRQAPGRRPWVALNMVSSVDGAAVLDGVSGGLGGEADHALFHQLRGIADVIMAASGTVRAESYGPAKPSDEVRAARLSRGQKAFAPIAVITGSLSLDWRTPFFTDAVSRPIIITTPQAPEDRLAAAREHADVIATGSQEIDFAAAFEALYERGHRLVLLEGGPSINNTLFGLGLIDELNLSVAPTLVGGDPLRIIKGDPLEGGRSLVLDQVLQDGDDLFLRYLVEK